MSWKKIGSSQESNLGLSNAGQAPDDYTTGSISLSLFKQLMLLSQKLFITSQVPHNEAYLRLYRHVNT